MFDREMTFHFRWQTARYLFRWLKRPGYAVGPSTLSGIQASRLHKSRSPSRAYINPGVSDSDVKRILEISSKSMRPEGIAASAFNLRIELPDGSMTTVECAYQGSKVFGASGPYTDIFRWTSLDAKRDERLRRTDIRLTGFMFFEELWPLVPSSFF